MITHTDLQVEIGGNLTQGCMSLQLSQPIHGHHYFQARFSGEGLENDPLGLGSDSLNQIGQTFKTELSNNAGESSNFSGIITSVRAIASGLSGQGQIIVFEGYSPTILLENGQSCQSYVNMSLSDIISKACQGPATNLLKLSVNPSNDPKLTYIVQYNETAFEFANRMARRFGEWLYYDGSEMIVGDKKQSETTLTYGLDLQSFDLVMQSSSVIRQFTAHTYSGNQTQNINTKSVQPNISGIGKQVYNSASKTWPAPQNGILMHFDEGDSLKKQLDDVAKTAVEGAAANQVLVNGASTNPALHAGAAIKIMGFDTRDYGSYIVTAVNHQYIVGGNYHNTFTAVPSDVKASPYTNPALTPRCESQAGVVEDNNDPDNLGRVKVRLYWQKDSVTPWLRIASPYGGSNKGIYFIPETGEEVMVGFEGGNAEMPYVQGTLYHSDAKPDDWKSNTNDIKAIRTRSGHTIEFCDQSGNESIVIKDSKGNMIQLDTVSGNLMISAPENISFSAKNIDISASESISIGARDNLSIHAGEDFTLAAKNTTTQAEESAHLSAKKIDQNANKIRIDSTKDPLELASGKTVDLQSNEKVRLF